LTPIPAPLTVLDRLPGGARVAILRLRSLGDCVLTTPALHLLKSHRPDLRIGVAVESRFAGVYEGNPDVAEILPPEAPALRRFRPALCLNLHGGTRSTWLTVLSGARYRAGFQHHRFGRIYNLRIPRAQDILGVERRVHTAEHLAAAMFFLGVPRQEVPRARLVTGGPSPVAGSYAVLHPFASHPEKTWPAERFAALARWLEDSCGLRAVFTGGEEDDFRPFAGFRCLRGRPLRETVRLIAGAALFVGNDSGPAHVAAAFGLPVVVIFGASDREVWAPWRTPAAVLHAPGGIAAVTVEDVQRAVAQLRVAA
jgi:ADP-heptose:LPS heptosyltransferase